MPYLHETTPEKEAEIAQQALASGDLQHAIYHIGTALQFDPRRPEWVAVLDEVIRRAPDALTLVRMDDAKSDIITAATRAYVHAQRGEYEKAFALLAATALQRPDAPFLAWGADWAKQPAALQSVSPEALTGDIIPALLHFVSHVPVGMADDDVRRPNVEAANGIFAAAAEALGQTSLLLFAQSMACRRLGYHDHAIYYAYEAFQKDQDWKGAIGVALAYREAGKLDDATQWFRWARSLDPEEVSPLVDLADMLLEAERWDDALAVYNEILEAEPGHRWAESSKTYIQFVQNPDPAIKNQLFRQADHSGRAWELFCRIQPPEPYVHHLPPAADATANAIRDLLRNVGDDARQAHGGTLGVKVTHPESPSIVTALRLWAESRGIEVALDITVDKIQTPDPRSPKGQVDFTLWFWDDGDDPHPNVPGPDPRAADAVASIAVEPYNLEIWEPIARDFGNRMGPAWIPQLVSTMVFPPALPSPRMEPMEWVARAQIAAALIIAYTETDWEPSHRKRALFSIALGPVDWTVDAALIALAWLGRQDAAIAADITPMFAWLRQQIPENGYTCFEYPLACASLWLAGQDSAGRAELETWRAAIETRNRAAPDAEQEETHGGLTLEQYAEFSVRRDAIVQSHGMSIGGALLAASGGGAYPELETLCRELGVDLTAAAGGTAAAGHIPAWDERINSDPWVAEQFFAMQNDARLKLQGIEFSSHEGRVAEMIRSGHFDTQGAMAGAQEAARQMEAGQGGDPDPVVFPGQPLERLSHYVGLMKHMQTGDMMGALAAYGLDMGSYTTAAQAWGVKLASDPLLSAKFSEMMAS